MQSNTLYPIFLKVDKIPVLIVGGGETGTEKLHFMLKNSPDALVTLVAPVVSDEILDMARRHPHVRIKQRPFETTDLEGVELLIVAIDNHGANLEIRRLAKARGILTNVADTPEQCDFYLGSIVTKGDLKVAISTNGKSPTFAKRFRQYLEEILPEETPRLLENLRLIRDQLKGDFAGKVKELNRITNILKSDTVSENENR